MSDDYKKGYKQAMIDVHKYCAELREYQIKAEGTKVFSLSSQSCFHSISSIGEWAYKQRNKCKVPK